MPDLNEKFKTYQNKPVGTEKLDISDKSLRQQHIAIENIFDNLKSHKSSRDFKWLFLLLISIVLIATAIHISKFGAGFNLLPILLVIAFWAYYRLTLKRSLEEQAVANSQINAGKTPDEDNRLILSNRVKYILNGIKVLETRISLIRNQYVVFFPVFTILVIDIIRGPMSWGAFIVTSLVSILLGGVFWIYYFRNDLIDLENASLELEAIRENLAS